MPTDIGFFYGVPASRRAHQDQRGNFHRGGQHAPLRPVLQFRVGTNGTTAATNLVAAINAYNTANPGTFTYTASNTGGFFGGR